MKDFLEQLPSLIARVLEVCIQIGEEENLSIFAVGGFVRDFLLGIRNWDIDLVVESGDFKRGYRFAQRLAERLKGRAKFHLGFGTAVILFKYRNREMRMDVASARKERYKKPGVLPQVSPATLEEDLRRRDFSINAMAIALSKQERGRLIDPFSGKKDLRAKRIRVLHNLSFVEDPTRILRAVRFAVRYDFHIERKTKRLLREAVREGRLAGLKSKRIQKEIELILKEKAPMKVFSALLHLTAGI